MPPAKPARSLLLASLAAVACLDVPVDSGARVVPPSGVIRGSVLYAGPPPCTRAGHVVGNAVLFVFNSDDPPPPSGLAELPVNFAVVPGDVLFASTPRTTSPVTECPDPSSTILASAPYAVSPLGAGTYVIHAFFDRSGDFLPTFKFRDLPKRGDIGGGYVDPVAPSPPPFLPVRVGTASAGAPVIPPEGFVADGIPVTLGIPFALPRPVFTPPDAPAAPDDAPAITMEQDHQLAPPPARPDPAAFAAYEASFLHVTLRAGVPAAEAALAGDPNQVFRFEVGAPFDGLYVFSAGVAIPEGGIPKLWPEAAFTKLLPDDARAIDPQSIRPQQSPIVIAEGITLSGDSLLATVAAPVPTTPTTPADHVTALVRPSVLCVDPSNVRAGGLLVTPHFTAEDGSPLFDPQAVILASSGRVRETREACLPAGRYAINLVYPTGQAWTTPNEAGSCAALEGPRDPITGGCTGKPRPVLPSQGLHGVLAIVPPASDAGRAWCASHPVPAECTLR